MRPRITNKDAGAIAEQKVGAIFGLARVVTEMPPRGLNWKNVNQLTM